LKFLFNVNVDMGFVYSSIENCNIIDVIDSLIIRVVQSKKNVQVEINIQVSSW
jgi:hypothetical protein